MSRTRKTLHTEPHNYGWRHIDIRINADGTIDILTDTLAVLGFSNNASGKVYPFKDRGLTTIKEALEQGKLIDDWLDSQVGSKRITKAEGADNHYNAVAMPVVAPGEEPPADVVPPPLVLEPEKPAPLPPPPKPPEPAPKPKPTAAAKPVTTGSKLGLFDDL